MKVCSKCGIEKDESEFNKDSRHRDGLQSSCKKCTKDYYKSNAEQIKEYQKEYQKSNAEQIKEYKKEYYKSNAEQKKEYQKEYKKSNAEQIKEYQKEYYKSNAEQILEKQKEYKKSNAEQILEKQKEYQKEYQKQRKKTDTLYKLSCNIRSLICQSISKMGFKKSSRTSAILGCTFEEFKMYIEKQFTDGMTWDNRHLWHLDHIYPVSLAESEEHLIAAKPLHKLPAALGRR
ncbi:MAG: hypothetical protein PHG08_01140 [Bacilli bacterium]|nr:hypothetical protein [Bacilli bacterium]